MTLEYELDGLINDLYPQLSHNPNRYKILLFLSHLYNYLKKDKSICCPVHNKRWKEVCEKIILPEKIYRPCCISRKKELLSELKFRKAYQNYSIDISNYPLKSFP